MKAASDRGFLRFYPGDSGSHHHTPAAIEDVIAPPSLEPLSSRDVADGYLIPRRW
jgi:hypothetical protein